MADYTGLTAQCEELYAAAARDGAAWPDAALADWVEGIAASGALDREVGRELRRVVRVAQKLRDFWLDPPDGHPPDHGDWRARVDIAQGARAWRPLLAIARIGLERDPDAAVFEEVKARLRVVTGERWMEGVSFEEWSAGDDS